MLEQNNMLMTKKILFNPMGNSRAAAGVCVGGRGGKMGSQRPDYYISDSKYMFELKEGKPHMWRHAHTQKHTHT